MGYCGTNFAEWWIFQWWHVPIVIAVILSIIVISALVITSFYVIHEVNYLSEDLKQMDETFLKTLSEHDRNILEQCVRISYQQTREQVAKLWSIYMKRDEIMRKRRDDEAKMNLQTLNAKQQVTSSEDCHKQSSPAVNKTQEQRGTESHSKKTS